MNKEALDRRFYQLISPMMSAPAEGKALPGLFVKWVKWG